MADTAPANTPDLERAAHDVIPRWKRALLELAATARENPDQHDAQAEG